MRQRAPVINVKASIETCPRIRADRVSLGSSLSGHLRVAFFEAPYAKVLNLQEKPSGRRVIRPVEGPLLAQAGG